MSLACVLVSGEQTPVLPQSLAKPSFGVGDGSAATAGLTEREVLGVTLPRDAMLEAEEGDTHTA